MAEFRSCLVRIMEQFENLKEYFLVKLPSMPGFNGKNGIRETENYQRIRKAFNEPKTKIYMSFVINLSQSFKGFILPHGLLYKRPNMSHFHLKIKRPIKKISWFS